MIFWKKHWPRRTAPSSWGTPRGRMAPSTYQSHTCGDSTQLVGWIFFDLPRQPPETDTLAKVAAAFMRNNKFGIAASEHDLSRAKCHSERGQHSPRRTAPRSWGRPRGRWASSTHQSHTCGESTLLKGQHETSNTARSTFDV